MPQPLPVPELARALEALISCPARERRAMLAALGPEARVQVVAALVEEGYAHRHAGPKRYLRLAQLANQCAYRHLKSPAALLPAARQVRAAALGFLANAYRVRELFSDAGRCWEKVGDVEKACAGNLVLGGLLYRFRATLDRSQYRYPEALKCLELAKSCFQRAQAPHQAGIAGIVAAKLLDQAGSSDDACRECLDAVGLLDTLREPGHLLSAQQYLGWFLLNLGQLDQAYLLVRDMRWMVQSLAEPAIRQRCEWLEGTVCAEVGASQRAVELLDGVRLRFLEQDLTYDASLASLHLALAYVQRGQQHQVRRLVLEMYPAYISDAIPAEARNAFMDFCAAADEWMEEAKIRDVLTRLRNLEQRPFAVAQEPSASPP